MAVSSETTQRANGTQAIRTKHKEEVPALSASALRLLLGARVAGETQHSHAVHSPHCNNKDKSRHDARSVTLKPNASFKSLQVDVLLVK